MTKPVILTGIRSNDDPTIANYLGAMVPMVQMQQQFGDTHQINMFVPDLHSFTMPIDHSVLYANTLKNLKYFIAAGIDISHPNTHIYRQSYIPAHSEMAWILDCFTYVGEMQRMNEYKDKSSKNIQGITMGLLNYPVLMAADILLYGAKHIPVGKDQFQHLEITRDIATRFNNKFGETFVIPDSTDQQSSFMQRDSGLRIRSLTDPTKKMSKSSDDQKSKINLHDSPEEARKKIMGAVTDDLAVINFDYATQPGISSLLQILAILTGVKQDTVNARWVGTTSYGELKKTVADVVSAFLIDFHTRYDAISDQEVLAKLESSEHAMNEVANQTLLRVQQAVGLRK